MNFRNRLERGNRAACGFKLVNLMKDTVKVLGVHFSYNRKTQLQNNLLHTRTKNNSNLTLEEKALVFKMFGNFKNCVSCFDDFYLIL